MPSPRAGRPRHKYFQHPIQRMDAQHAEFLGKRQVLQFIGQSHFIHVVVEVLAKRQVLQTFGQSHFIQTLVEVLAKSQDLQAIGQSHFIHVVVGTHSRKRVLQTASRPSMSGCTTRVAAPPAADTDGVRGLPIGDPCSPPSAPAPPCKREEVDRFP